MTSNKSFISSSFTVCMDCRLPQRETEIVTIDSHLGKGKFCWNCTFSIVSKEINKEKVPNTKELKEKFIKKLKEHFQYNSSINFEALTSLCNSVYFETLLKSNLENYGGN